MKKRIILMAAIISGLLLPVHLTWAEEEIPPVSAEIQEDTVLADADAGENDLEETLAELGSAGSDAALTDAGKDESDAALTDTGKDESDAALTDTGKDESDAALTDTGKNESETNLADGSGEGTENTEDNTEEKEKISPRLWIIVAVCIAAVAVIMGVILLLRKKKAGKNDASENEVSVSVQVIDGNCRTKKRQFSLTSHNAITIGRGKKCDLIFEDMDVSELHARIVLRNDKVYVENVSLGAGTYLEGMRIQGMNRLDSKDTIKLGSAKFTIEIESGQ